MKGFGMSPNILVLFIVKRWVFSIICRVRGAVE